MKLSKSIYFGVVLLIAIMTSLTCSADDISVELVSHIYESPLQVNVVVVEGDYAYIGQGLDFVVLDISDVSTPKEVGKITTPSEVWGIAVSGDYAYVADYSSGLVIVDISDPSSPAIVGNYDTPDLARGVAVAGNYAYLTEFRTIYIIDISDPAFPSLVGSYTNGGEGWNYDGDQSWDVAISGNYAYIADNWNGLVIVDISDPSSPEFKGVYDTARVALDVAISGNYAYVADDTSGLVIVDVSNPSSPRLAASYDPTDNDPAEGDHAEAVDISGNYAYLANGYGNLVIVDISNPSSPKIAGKYDTVDAGYSSNIDVSGNYVYLAEGWSGLDILEVGASNLTGGGSETITGETGAQSSGQWATGATASTEYTVDRWSANQATGAPNTDTCGDIATAWAPLNSGLDPEWLNLSFSTPVLATGIRVHETNIAGFIYQVDLVDTSGQKHMIWAGTDSTVCPGWFEITFSKTSYAVNGVILYTKIAGWEEVDAVELLGEKSSETTTMFSPPSSSSAGITFESRSTPTGTTVQVPITLKGVTDKIGNMDFTLEYDPLVLEAKEVLNGPLTETAIFDSNILDGTIKFSLASNEGFSGDGVIAYVKFNVIGASGSSSPLKITSVSANNADSMQTISLSANDGLFKVITVAEGGGDADGDGIYSARDALAALQMSVGKMDKQSFMDMNQDGDITSLDARMILQLAVK